MQAARSQRLGSDGNQASQCTVQCHGQVSLAEQDAGNNQTGDQTTSSSSVGVDEDLGNSVGIGDVGYNQLRTTVEAEPAQPQDEHTQSGQRQVGARDGVDLTVGAVLALTSAQQQHTGQSSGSTGHVNHTGTGEVEEASFVQEATAPLPEALDRVDEASHDHGEDQEREQLHALGNRTGNDGHGSRNEYDLEEEVRSNRVVRCIVATGEYVFNGVLGTDQHAEAREDTAFRAGVHDVVADQQIHGARRCVQGHVLGQNFSGVLGADQTGFEHGKTRRHPHHQSTADQKVECIKRVLDLYDVFHFKPPI